MPVNPPLPQALPRTAAALAKALRELVPTPARAKEAATDAAALASWVQAREVPTPSLNPYISGGGKSVSSPTLFPPGTSRPFVRFAQVVERLPYLIAALEASTSDDVPASTAKAAPLYTAVWPAGIRCLTSTEPQHWFPDTPPWSGPNNADAVSTGAPITDVQTDKPVETEGRADYFALAPDPVFWWPSVPTDLAADGRSVLDCPTEALITGGFMALPAYAATLALLDGRADGYGQRFAALRTLTGPDRGRIRTPYFKAATAFRRLASTLDPVADLMAAELAQYLDTVNAAIAALAPLQISGDTPMPLSNATPASISTLAASIRDSITSGHGGRIAVNEGGETAFSWSPGIASTLLRYLALGTAVGRRTTVVIASDSGTAKGSVAEGGTKPNAVNFASTEVDLLKYAGIATLSMESSQFISNIETAISVTMTSRLVRGIEADVVTAILANAGVSIPGAADMTDGVLAAIAAIRNNGGTATVVGLSSGDWLAIMKATGNGSYLNFSNPEAGPAGTWLGLYPVIIPTLTDGTAVVLDGSAVTVLEAAGGPLAIVDCVTMLVTNQVRVALECFAVGVVNSPGGVAKVVTALASTAEVVTSGGKRATASV